MLLCQVMTLERGCGCYDCCCWPLIARFLHQHDLQQDYQRFVYRIDVFLSKLCFRSKIWKFRLFWSQTGCRQGLNRLKSEPAHFLKTLLFMGSGAENWVKYFCRDHPKNQIIEEKDITAMVCCAGMRQIEIFFLQVMLGIFYTNFFLFWFCCLPKILHRPKAQKPR